MSNSNSNWTTTWKTAVSEDTARQWVYDGSAREAAEAKGLTVIASHESDDVVLAEDDSGELLAVGMRKSDIFVVNINRK